jgi:hypothetical protein
MGGTAGIRAMDLFSTTYFGENIIFGLSKDQTFRIRCTPISHESGKIFNFSHTSI